MARSSISSAASTPNTSPKPYHLEADLVRVVAIFGVVGIHVLTSITARPDFFGGTFWWLCFLMMSWLRASVPLFVMLSGYLVLVKSVTLKQNTQRLLTRLGIPLLSFYLIYNAYAWWVSTNVPERAYDAMGLFHNLHKNTYSYLYFLVILMFLYAVKPVLRLIFTSGDKALQRYSITFFFGLSLMAMIARYTSLRVGDVFNTYALWVLWIGFFLYGAWVKENLSLVRTWWKWSTAGVVIGYLLTVGMSFAGWWMHYQGNDSLFVGGGSYGDEYLSIGVMLMSVSIFNLAMTMPATALQKIPGVVQRLVRWLAPLSFGLYLIHPMIIDILHLHFGIYADNPLLNLPLYVLLNAKLTFVISLLLAWIISRIPVVKKTIGL